MVSRQLDVAHTKVWAFAVTTAKKTGVTVFFDPLVRSLINGVPCDRCASGQRVFKDFGLNDSDPLFLRLIAKAVASKKAKPKMVERSSI